jgi:hypothetical protein
MKLGAAVSALIMFGLPARAQEADPSAALLQRLAKPERQNEEPQKALQEQRDLHRQ